MAEEGGERRFDPFAVIVLAGLLLLIVGGIYLFPQFLHAVQYMDCVAAGYGNCRVAPAAQ